MKIFAYGSNMCSKRLKKRKIKSARFVDIGFVKQHRIAFHKKSKDGSGKADCYFTGIKRDKIWGVIFEITNDEKEILDRYEGVGKGYIEKEVSVNCKRKEHKAISYIATCTSIDDNLKPYDWYLEYIIKGAEEVCLPLSYIQGVLRKIEAVVDQDEERRKMEFENLDVKKNDNIDMGGFKVFQWKSIRKKLRLSKEYNQEWEEAVHWFKERLNLRYLNPIKQISCRIDGAGFTITSILCVSIEHLAAVRNGKIYNYLKRGENPKYEYRHSEKIYKSFLGEAQMFKEYFYTEDGAPAPFCVDDFYKNVRCALLHEACTKNNWVIRVHDPCKQQGKKLFAQENYLKIIYRDILQEKIIEYIDSYVEELKKDFQLRLNFARKMDSICELNPDPINYEWWIDK